jgi:hypothetical protein
MRTVIRYVMVGNRRHYRELLNLSDEGIASAILADRLKRLVPISSVVLSGQRVDLKDATYNASKQKECAKEEAANPLVLNGQKLIPSVTRVFSKSRDLYVYLQAYEQGVTTSQPLIAFVSFYQGQTKMFETQPMEVASGMSNSLKTMPFRFSIGLNPLPPGDYDCQVTVLDPTGEKRSHINVPHPIETEFKPVKTRSRIPTTFQ